jgi:hypothetical protein
MKLDAKKLHVIGKFFYYTKTFRFYKDGDGYSYIWNYHNPLSYIIMPIWAIVNFMLLLLTGGIPDVHRYFLEDSGFRLKKYFREHPEQLVFFD